MWNCRGTAAAQGRTRRSAEVSCPTAVSPAWASCPDGCSSLLNMGLWQEAALQAGCTCRRWAGRGARFCSRYPLSTKRPSAAASFAGVQMGRDNSPAQCGLHVLTPLQSAQWKDGNVVTLQQTPDKHTSAGGPRSYPRRCHVQSRQLDVAR